MKNTNYNYKEIEVMMQYNYIPQKCRQIYCKIYHLVNINILIGMIQ